MGDRGNVVIHQHNDELIYLYTHWGGSELPFTVQRALAKRWRWEDESYLARIIFDAITEGFHGTETGFGIATYPCDNEYSMIVVNPSKQTVGFAHEKSVPICYKTWKFEEYVFASKKTLEQIFNVGE